MNYSHILVSLVVLVVTFQPYVNYYLQYNVRFDFFYPDFVFTILGDMFTADESTGAGMR